MKKVLFLMFAVMLIVGLMAGPALASAPDVVPGEPGAFGHAIANHAQGGDRGAIVSQVAKDEGGFSARVFLTMDGVNWPPPHAE